MSTPTSSSSSESCAVLGGEGFLGGALVSALLSRHPASHVASLGLTQRRFDTPSGAPYRFFRTDITSYDSVLAALRASGATTVFHTASPHAKASARVWREVNVGGTAALVRACRDAGVRKLVFTSSMTVVYEQGVALKNVDERMPRIREDEDEGEETYAGTKAKAEQLVLEANGQDGLLTCALRIGGIIGPGDRQVLPGFIGVYNAGQSAFQMGDNLNLFDFVTVKNVVHAHLLAAERLDAPPIPLTTLDNRLPAIACTVQRRALPTSKHPEPIDPANPPPSDDPPFPSSRNRWNQFFRPATGVDDSSAPDSDLTLAGQAVFITNGEPIAFWSFARAVYHAYSARPPRWYEPVALPSAVGMLFATLSEWAGWVQGRRPDECGVNRAYMAYVLRDMYFDIERARRLLGYEPIESLEEGIRTGVEWYKRDEAREKERNRAGQAKTK
ncbi:uncharacterized protein JCM10292_001779 [Rhodotorula paludigena]|uniref:uncharacterized protein n=1 Tax=Rhodotorula paludigena TaxID=86838 RepID=UPI003174B6EB